MEVLHPPSSGLSLHFPFIADENAFDKSNTQEMMTRHKDGRLHNAQAKIRRRLDFLLHEPCQ
jgi:hypothetical protein